MYEKGKESDVFPLGLMINYITIRNKGFHLGYHL